MNSLRKWLYKPKKTDNTFLAQFYFADEELNLVAAELDSFDGRKDPERCTMLVNQLRICQDKVLSVIQSIMDDGIPGQRANRDFRVKFPDDVLQESLAGQLWFGAECLAAGSSILNREVESASMRPLARALTKNLDSLRGILRDQCLRSCTEYSERIKEALVIFDKLFAEFELSYVSAMVPVKTMKEYDLLQEVTVLFSETVHRALLESLLSQDMIDYCDPALMFTIPRLAIVCGLFIYPEGPLNPDMEPTNMTEMYRPFQTLLHKIRELLYTLSAAELALLEKALCSSEEPEVSTPSAAGTKSEAFLQIDQGFHEGGEGIVPLQSIDPNIIVHSPSSGSPVTPVNLSMEVVDFGLISPCSTLVEDLVDDLNQSDTEEGSLNKSESQDSGLQSEIVSTSDTVTADCPPLVSHDVEGATQCTVSHDIESDGHRTASHGTEGATQLGASHDTEGATECTMSGDLDGATSCTESHDLEVANQCILTSGKEIHSDEAILHVSETGEITKEPDTVCDKIENCVNNEDSVWINDENCLKSCCHVKAGSGARHLCREIVDEIVINAVHYDDNDGTCDTDIDEADRSLCCNSQNGDINAVSDQDVVDKVADDDSELAVSGISRQFSWQYNVQFALPQLSLAENDSAERRSSSSFSSDSTISESAGQPTSMSDFVIETLANMNRTSQSSARESGRSDDNSTLEHNDESIPSSSATSQRSASKDSRKLPSNAAPASSVTYKLKKHDNQPTLGKSPATNSHQSTLDKTSTNCSHKGRQGKRDSVENISCGVGAHAQPVDAVQRVKDDDGKAMQIVKTEDISSCSSGPDSVCSECDCDTHCSCMQSETSSFNSETNDEEEIALAIQAAETASRNEARSKFRSSSDLIHRLFVCIAGVADQLQTNYASDLRHILKCVFEMNTDSIPEPDNEIVESSETPNDNDDPSLHGDGVEDQPLPCNQIDNRTQLSNQTPPCSNPITPPSNESPVHRVPRTQTRNRVPSSPRRIFDEPPEWVPDEEVGRCTACKTPFTFVRRRHHCRNCGKIFCGKCSSTTMPLPHYGHQKPVRVCHRCFLYQVTHFTVSREF